MRKFAILLLALGLVTPAFAVTPLPVSIAKLNRLLAGAKKKSDLKVALMLTGLQLSERASLTQLAAWEAEFKGHRTRQALIALVDESDFLDPPTNDVVKDPAPDNQTQAQIVARAADYVSKTIAQLPDFYATRKTIDFEDAPSVSVAVEGLTNPLYTRVLTPYNGNTIESMYEPIHVAGTSSTTITYRNGYEVDADSRGGGKQSQSSARLTIQGEFGPILTIVMGDIKHGNLVFDHWERGVTGTLAVFHYWVPQQSAHWMVSLPEGDQTAHVYPAYHGEISIDPSSGAILRLTEIADFPAPYQAIEASVLVEYSSVTLGDRRYICPVKCVAISRAPVLGTAPAHGAPPPLQTLLSDVTFTQYHLFRADMRILTNVNDSSQDAAQPPAH